MENKIAALNSWVPLDGNWENILNEISEIGATKCVLVIDTKNWHYYFQLRNSPKYKYPKKRRDIEGYKEYRTEWMTIESALDRVKEWKECDFKHAIQSDIYNYFLNGMFEYIRIDGQVDGWLWCGTDNLSYCAELMAELIVFPTDIEAMIEVAKQNTETEINKLDTPDNDLKTDNLEI